MNTRNVKKPFIQNLNKGFSLLMIVILTITSFFTFAQKTVSAEAVAQPSLNVAVIDSFSVRNGGTFPTATTGPTGSFLDFNFFILPRASVSLASLSPGGVCGEAGCDTVLLNVASSGMACNINNLTEQQKADLITFVNLGRKLIIYDSECVAQDYSWLPVPFQTVNPGALGAQGTLVIVEENTLSSNDPADPNYIDAYMLSTQTDAVGDMNVMTTFSANWFLDMSGTNAIDYTGPVHTYANIPIGTDKGLIIYNGLDVDYLNSSTIPTSATAAGNLAKIWLQELQQKFNPSELPSSNPVIGIILTPESATLNVGEEHTVTATLTNLLGEPQPGFQVAFAIESGPNAGASGVCSTITDCYTEENGQVSFTYTGSGGPGIDQIVGQFGINTGDGLQLYVSDPVTAEWIDIKPIIHYFALGDSIASGHGLMDDETDCRKSTNAYPYFMNSFLLSRYTYSHFEHFACSGATAIIEPSKKIPEQRLEYQVDEVIEFLDQIPLNEPVLVTISIGANDLDWNSLTNLINHIILENGGDYYEWLDDISERVADEVKKQSLRLLDYSNVAIVINNLFNPVNEESAFFGGKFSKFCKDVPVGTMTCYQKSEAAISVMNTKIGFAILDIGQYDRIRMATAITGAFSSHESPRYSCGQALPDQPDTWIQYLGDPDSNAHLPYKLDYLLGEPGEAGDCFHPNVVGAENIAIIVNDVALDLNR